MTAPALFDLELPAAYFQFHLTDGLMPGELTDAWTDESMALGFAAAPWIVGVATQRNGPVPVRFELHETTPPLDLDAWDRVVEGPLEIPSGSLVVMGCDELIENARRFKVPSGKLRVRASTAGLGSPGGDRYRVQVWPAASTDSALAIWKRT